MAPTHRPSKPHPPRPSGAGAHAGAVLGLTCFDTSGGQVRALLEARRPARSTHDRARLSARDGRRRAGRRRMQRRMQRRHARGLCFGLRGHFTRGCGARQDEWSGRGGDRRSTHPRKGRNAFSPCDLPDACLSVGDPFGRLLARVVLEPRAPAGLPHVTSDCGVEVRRVALLEIHVALMDRPQARPAGEKGQQPCPPQGHNTNTLPLVEPNAWRVLKPLMKAHG